MTKRKFKETEIGEIPGGWKRGNLCEIAVFKNGKSSPERNDIYNNPVYGSNGIIGYSDKHNSETSTLVVGRVGSYCGSVYFSRKRCWVTDNAIKGIPKKNNSAEYLYYLLLSLRLNRHRGGSGQPLLNQGILNAIEVDIPPEIEQKAIAKILSDLDLRIELNQQMNKTLEAIGQALYKRWFVDFEFPNEEGKPYKSSGGEMVDSELEEIPKGWEIMRLSEIANFKNGVNYNRDTCGDSKYCIVNVRNIAASSYIVKNMLDRIPIDSKKAIPYLVKKDSILIIRSASPGEIGFVMNDYDDVIYSGFIIKAELVDSRFKYYVIQLLQSKKRELLNLSDGTTLKNINQTSLNGFKLVLPSMELIEKYNKIAHSICTQIFNNKEQNELLSNIRDSLLPRLMNGKIIIGVEENNG